MTEVSVLLELLAARAGEHGGPAVLAIDGRSGAGKSTLSRRIVAACEAAGRSVTVIEVEDYIEGWSGLVAGTERIANLILKPVRRGTWPVVARWNWHDDTWHTPEPVPAADVLLLVGCGSTSAACAPYDDVTVWIDVPERVRLAHVTARDGDPSAWWEPWQAQEAALLRERNSPALADLVLREH